MQVESKAPLSGIGSLPSAFTQGGSPAFAGASSEFLSEDSRRLSTDLDAYSASHGFAVRADLPLATPTQMTMGAVLGVVHQTDELAKGMAEDAELSSDLEVV